MLINDCGWKDGDSGDSAAKNLLTQTGLLMEGDLTQNPGSGILSAIEMLQPLPKSVQAVRSCD